MMHLSYPFAIDARGGTSYEENARAYIRQLLESVLFTTPGERVNNPEFGSGLLSLLFMPSSDAQAASAEILIQSALQAYLSDLLVVEALKVRHESEGKLVIDLTYRLIGSSGAAQSERIERVY